MFLCFHKVPILVNLLFCIDKTLYTINGISYKTTPLTPICVFFLASITTAFKILD